MIGNIAWSPQLKISHCARADIDLANCLIIIKTYGIDKGSSDPLAFHIEKRRILVVSILSCIIPTIFMTSGVIASRSLSMAGSGHVAVPINSTQAADQLTFPSSLQPHLYSDIAARAAEIPHFPPVTAIPGTCYNDMIPPMAPGNTWMHTTWWSNMTGQRYLQL